MIASQDTIAAVSTPNGVGGIAVIRVSGPEAVSIVDEAWKGKKLSEAMTHTAHLGKYSGINGNLLDECVATVFRAPKTFTGEDVVEISIHGSKWLQREILNDLIHRGARVAEPGEFTRRAFLNGRLDLAQAEGIADLIAASSKAAHTLAISQTGGNFSRAFESLREKLIEFASLLELELDFSEEDIEFADREKMLELARTILTTIQRLSTSYSSGSVLKEGVPVVIAGVPNAGKSSLLNLLLNDDKAIVSEIPGTTRDTIEDIIEIDGILYRFIDTAGLRQSDDIVETIGIGRARERMKKARIVLWLIDPTFPLSIQKEELNRFTTENQSAQLILLINKSDLITAGREPDLANTSVQTVQENLIKFGDNYGNNNAETRMVFKTHISEGFDADKFNKNFTQTNPILFSTKTGEGFDELRKRLSEIIKETYNSDSEIIVTNARHYEALIKGSEALQRAIDGIENGISGDFIAQDVREVLHHLGTITGTITTPTLLQSIFTRFCIGK